MQEKTLKSYLESGLRIQFVNIRTSFVVGESFQIRVNRRRVLTTTNYEKALKRFNIEVSKRITQLSFNYD